MEPEVAWPGVPPGPQGAVVKKGENGGGGRKKKKLIKNKILTSPARLLLGASSSCARVTERAARAQLGGRAKSRIWEKSVFKHRWIEPLFPFKLHLNALATLEVLVGLAGLEQVWGECPQGTCKTQSCVTWGALADLCSPRTPFPILLLFPNPILVVCITSDCSSSAPSRFQCRGVTGAAPGLCPVLSSCVPLEKHIWEGWACSPFKTPLGAFGVLSRVSLCELSINLELWLL